MDKHKIVAYWLCFYGEIPKDMEILREFNRIMSVRFNDLYDYALAAHIDGLSDQLLLRAIEENNTDAFLDEFHYKFASFKEEHADAYEIMENYFLTNVLSSQLNNKGPIDLEIFGKGR